MLETVGTALRAPDIRRKILYTLGILLVFRALTNVPVPNVNTAALSDLFATNALLNLYDTFSGGGLVVPDPLSVTTTESLPLEPCTV